jgi:hypothetical protein
VREAPSPQIVGYASPTTPEPSSLRQVAVNPAPWSSEARAATWVLVLTVGGLTIGTGKDSIGSWVIIPVLGCVTWFVVARFNRRKRTPKLCLWTMYVATSWCMTWTTGLVLWAEGDLIRAFIYKSYFVERVLMLLPGIALFAVADLLAFVLARRRKAQPPAPATPAAPPTLPDPAQPS